MPVQPPEERIRNFDEVATGYTLEMAAEEAARCLQCKNQNVSKAVLWKCPFRNLSRIWRRAT